MFHCVHVICFHYPLIDTFVLFLACGMSKDSNAEQVHVELDIVSFGHKSGGFIPA